MKYSQFQRTELLLGKSACVQLSMKRVALIGLGGVGSYAAEALARAGVGHFLLIDFDKVNLSNLNRQLLATHATVGKFKTEVMRDRILSINPSAEVKLVNEFLGQENRIDHIRKLDYVIDAIDALGPKAGLIEHCIQNQIPMISVMGAGNRLDPSKVQLSLLSKSWNCPLARRVRKFLRRRGIATDIPVVFSSEPAVKPELENDEEADEVIMDRGRARKTVGSISYLPAIMGLTAAAHVIRTLANPTSEF